MRRWRRRILHDALAGKSVVVFRTPDAADDDVDALTRMVGAGRRHGHRHGGADAGVRRRQLGGEAAVGGRTRRSCPPGTQLSTTSVDQGSQAGDLLGIALLIDSGPDASRVDDAQRETVLAALRDTGFLTYADRQHRRGQHRGRS